MIVPGDSFCGSAKCSSTQLRLRRRARPLSGGPTRHADPVHHVAGAAVVGLVHQRALRGEIGSIVERRRVVADSASAGTPPANSIARRSTESAASRYPGRIAEGRLKCWIIHAASLWIVACRQVRPDLAAVVADRVAG